MYKRWMDLARTLVLSQSVKQLSSSRPSAMDGRARCLRVDLQLLREDVRRLSPWLPRPRLLQGRLSRPRASRPAPPRECQASAERRRPTRPRRASAGAG